MTKTHSKKHTLNMTKNPIANAQNHLDISLSLKYDRFAFCEKNIYTL